MPAHEVRPITAIRTVSEGFSTRARTIISGSVGITRNQFSSASRLRSVQPPKYPPVRPTTDPRTAEMKAAANPTTTDTRAPTRSWEKTSDPFSVVPRMWLQEGACRTAVLDAYGS